MPTETISLSVNGDTHALEVDPSTPLLFVLRNRLGLTGAKLGCGLEQCGACAVLVDGASTLSCVAPVAQFEGKAIVTVEAAVESGKGREVREAFVAEGAAQCGYCTPGIVVAVTALVTRDPSPSEQDIRAALQPHLCRCGSHARVLAAVRRVAGRAA